MNRRLGARLNGGLCRTDNYRGHPMAERVSSVAPGEQTLPTSTTRERL
jgi:hypothetical protein